MKIRPLSDVHNEFGLLNLPEIEGESGMVCVLAGDIGLAKTPYTFNIFIEDMCERHMHVIYIPGNHEYYHTSFLRGIPKIEEALNKIEFTNWSFGNNFVVRIGNVTFVCSTLWTNMDNLNATTMANARWQMNDYKLIRFGPKGDPYQRRLTPEDTIADHTKSKEFVFSSIEDLRKKGTDKIVVVTHMGPSFQSVAEHYRSHELNGAYVSNLEEDILETKPDLWLHGHVHASNDYQIGDTRVVVNPRGYAGHEVNPNFDPRLVIEV